jgi:hypothetical protein
LFVALLEDKRADKPGNPAGAPQGVAL